MRVVQPRVDHDPAHGDVPCCWVCRQRWPHAFSLVLDKHHRELRIDGAPPVPIRPTHADVLAVLINSSPRWMTRSHILEHAFAERPDVDMPRSSALNAAVRGIREALQGTQYVVESDQHNGWRLVTEEYLARERAEYLAQIPNTGKRKLTDMGTISLGAIKKTPGAKTKPTHTGGAPRLHPEGRSRRSKKGQVTPAMSKNNQMKRKKRTALDV